MCATATAEEDNQPDELEAVLAYHDGDAEAAIRTLLADCAHLRGQLALASGVISKGFVRGWNPEEERQDVR
ncbi:MAG: CUE domain-containing protein [Shinella sp.]|nr:CUE domain-containing protein [Shinella sp.]